MSQEHILRSFVLWNTYLPSRNECSLQNDLVPTRARRLQARLGTRQGLGGRCQEQEKGELSSEESGGCAGFGRRGCGIKGDTVCVYHLQEAVYQPNRDEVWALFL
jgi:hypothetical protein